MFAAFVSTAGIAQSSEPLDIAPFVAREVGPKVHLLTTPDDYYGPAIGNVILVEQRDGFLVADSGLNAGNGRAVVRYAKSLANKPIKAVMITHWHNDHPQGVSAIRNAYPKVRIIATRGTEAGMLGPEAFDIGYAPAPRWDEAMAKLTAKAKGDLQKLLDDPSTAADRKERIRKAIPQFDAVLRDFRGSYIVPPTETFEKRLVIDDADFPVQILYLGRANTEGDALAWLPKQKILITGDIVVAPTPFGFGSFPADWIETIGKIKAMGFTTLVPGHGLPQTDTAYLDKLVASISDLRAQVGPSPDRECPSRRSAGRSIFRNPSRCSGAVSDSSAWPRVSSSTRWSSTPIMRRWENRSCRAKAVPNRTRRGIRLQSPGAYITEARRAWVLHLRAGPTAQPSHRAAAASCSHASNGRGRRVMNLPATG
jgi:glyoxylase-like metal-dependent hydrolase (beta-lactamase superfamily II)